MPNHFRHHGERPLEVKYPRWYKRPRQSPAGKPLIFPSSNFLPTLLLPAASMGPTNTTIPLDKGHTDQEQPPDQHDPLWYINTNTWFCEACLCSHPISQKDLPGCSKNHSSCHWNMPKLHNDITATVAERFHKFQQHHKQIILRSVTHFGALDHQARSYLRDLLVEGLFKVHTDTPQALTLHVAPRVIRMQDTNKLRLLVRYQWVYTSTIGRDMSYTELEPIRLCPHVEFPQDRSASTIASAIQDVNSIMSRFHAAVNDAPGSRQRGGSCRECRLDYTVGRWPNDRLNRAFVMVWQDLTPNDSTLENSDTRHIPDGHLNLDWPIHHMFTESEHVFCLPEEPAETKELSGQPTRAV